MNLVKTSFYTSISTAITFLSGFVVTKVVSVKIGPDGIAYFGQFQNVVAIFTMLATGAIATGVVKYLSQHNGDEEKNKKLINTAFAVVLCCSLIVSGIVMLTSGYLSESTFKTGDFWLVYFLFGLFTVCISFNVIFAAVLNGLKEIRWLTIINIITSLTSLALTVSSAYLFGVKGVLIASTALGFCMFIVNIFFFKKLHISWKPAVSSIDRSFLKLLSAFSLMAAISGFVIPAMQIFVRNKIILDYSVTEAGYWQAVTKISDYYLMFITTVLGVYYLPRLSEINNTLELRAEISKGYKIILPVVGAIALGIWLLRTLVIHVLFTEDFLPMRPYFTFQLLGDFFKIGSWLLAYIMLAKAYIKLYIFTELIFAATYVILCNVLINQYGVIGATYGFCINYALYWIVMFFIMRKKL